MWLIHLLYFLSPPSCFYYFASFYYRKFTLHNDPDVPRRVYFRVQALSEKILGISSSPYFQFPYSDTRWFHTTLGSVSEKASNNSRYLYAKIVSLNLDSKMVLEGYGFETIPLPWTETYGLLRCSFCTDTGCPRCIRWGGLQNHVILVRTQLCVLSFYKHVLSTYYVPRI